MRYLVCFNLLLISMALQAQSPLGFQLPDGKECYEMPFLRESNLIIIHVKINDAGPYKFILDTGSKSGIIFDKNLLDSTQVEALDLFPIFARDGIQIAEVFVTRNIQISIDSLGNSNRSMLVLKENELDIRSVLGVDAHGVLGSDFFARFVVEIDYREKKLRLCEHSQFSPLKGYKKYDIQLVNGRPFLEVSLKQRKSRRQDLNMLVDTGASSALFLDHENYDFLKLPRKAIDLTLGSSLIGQLKGKIGRVKKLKFKNRFKLKKVVTSFPEDWNIEAQLISGNDTIDRHGSIGADVLSKFDVVFDYLDQSLYLRKNDKFNEPFKFNRAGFNFIALGRNLDRFFISEIFSNSPAEENDLREADEIMVINGKLAETYTFSEIQSILQGSEGRSIDLIIERDGKAYRKSFKLKKLI